MSGEIEVVLVNKDDNILGFKEKFEAHKNPVPLHRAISVVIFNKDRKRMLLQKRTSGKPTWPLFWSNTVCSHPFPEEDYKHTAERRLKEEMGFSTALKEIFRFTYSVKYNETWGEHEYDVVFGGEYAGPVNPNPNEVADYKWVDIGGLKKDIAAKPELYTPWFKIILAKLKI